MSSAAEWGRAYARQAKADFDTWNELRGAKQIPQCHRLQFLQMACEKLAKAHLCKAGSDPYALRASHAYIAKALPIIARQQFAAATGKYPINRHGILIQIGHLARQIELLSPAVDENRKRPDNCEYPWEDNDGNLHIPAEHTFDKLSLLTEHAGLTMLKLIRIAISQLV